MMLIINHYIISSVETVKEQNYHQCSLSCEESMLIMRGCCLFLKPGVGYGGSVEGLYGVP